MRLPSAARSTFTKEGPMKRTIVCRGILALSLTIALFAATASTASATRILTPTSADYGNRQVATTSPAQAFTLRVRCTFLFGGCFQNDSFSPSISVSGEYGQTNNCPATLQGLNQEGQTCTINVTFTPTSTGPKEGTLSTGSGGPTAALTGNGVTTPTPPTPPTPGPAPPSLTLDLDAKKQELKKTLKFSATTNHDSTLAARGSVKRKVVDLAAGDKTKIKAKLKKSKRAQLEEKLARTGKAKAKVEVSVEDEFSDTAVDEIKVKLTD
jgi:hypothetical protein